MSKEVNLASGCTCPGDCSLRFRQMRGGMDHEVRLRHGRLEYVVSGDKGQEYIYKRKAPRTKADFANVEKWLRTDKYTYIIEENAESEASSE